MANFAVILDPDSSRRAVARRALLERIAPFSHLTTRVVERGNTVLAWALSPEAPRRVIETENEVVLVLGHLVGDTANRPLDLDQVEDGFHVVIRITKAGEVQVRPDLLGLFPVYYTRLGTDSLLVGTSPFLFHAHPDFRTALEPRAVVGLLYGNTMVRGRSLYRGVQRLNSGHGLRYSAAARCLEEVRQFEIPISDGLHLVTAIESADQLGDSLSRACARHLEAAKGQQVTLLLSGGHDSRILAGTMVDLKQQFQAVTLGRRDDVEAKCATLVARCLGLPHQVVNQPWAPEWFAMTLRWDALVTSPGTGASWGQVDNYREWGPWLVSGYVMDCVFGGLYVGLELERNAQASGFEKGFSWMNRSGFRSEVLAKLLRPEVFKDALREVHEELAADFAGLGTNDLERRYRLPLHHRMRFHTGGPIWKHGFGSWPVVPFLDRSVFETAGACPLPLLEERYLQQKLILQRFPRLATLPLDRNSYRDQALDPRFRDLVKTEIREQSVALLRRLTAGRWKRKERRQFHRNYDFNGPAWRWMRRSVEPDRSLAYELFDRKTFDQLLPPAEADWPGENSIEPAAGMKSLLGLVAWLREFAPGVPRT
jgi:asparagine synthase (glutamine-hydrolysing)